MGTCSYIFRNCKALLALYFALFLSVAFAQRKTAQPIPRSEWIECRIDSLRSVLLTNKSIDSTFEVPILAAMLFYPDLKETHIRFKQSPITTSMAALPAAGNIFRKPANRKYTILINSRINRNRAPLLSEAPYSARVGVIGHELAHIADYKSKSNLRLIYEGIAYYFNARFKRDLEHRIDRIAISRGLGEGILLFRLYVENESDATDSYKRFKRRIYLSAANIEALLQEQASAYGDDDAS